MQLEVVKEYYGKHLKSSKDLKTSACCGSGRDTYILAQLVGPDGEVVGVDMTDEQLATANAHLDGLSLA